MAHSPHHKTTRRRIACIWRGDDGVAAIEFAIIAVVLFTFLIGFIELALIFFTSSVLEGATSIGSRIGRTGYSAEGMSREDYIRQEVQRLSGGFLDDALLNIEMLSYNGFENVGQPEPCIPITDPFPCPGGYVDVNGDGQWSADQGIASAGENRAVVLYRVTYPWPVFTPLMREIIGNDEGNYNVTAVATVKNENF